MRGCLCAQCCLVFSVDVANINDERYKPYRGGHIVRTENSEISELDCRKNILKYFFHQKTIAFLKRSRRELSQTYLGSNQLSKNVLKKVRASWVHFGNFATWEQKNQRNSRNLVHEMEALLGDWKS